MRFVRVRSARHSPATRSTSVFEASTLSGTAVHRFGLITTVAFGGIQLIQLHCSRQSCTAVSIVCPFSPRRTTTLFSGLVITLLSSTLHCSLILRRYARPDRAGGQRACAARQSHRERPAGEGTVHVRQHAVQRSRQADPWHVRSGG